MLAAPALVSCLLLVGVADARPGGEVSVDSVQGHVRCHGERAEDLPLCEQVLVWAEQAWAVQVEGLGFHPAFPDGELGGSEALDLYLRRTKGGAGAAWVDCDGGDPQCIDADAGDGRAGASAYVVIDVRTSTEQLPHFVHHELNHVWQYAMDYTEPYLVLWEGTAVAAEGWTDDPAGTSISDFGDYQATPWLSAVLQDGYFLADAGFAPSSWYEYGSVAWIWFMDDRFGDGAGAIGPLLWQAAGRPEADLLDAWQELSGDWRSSLLDFAAERARMGGEGSPDWVPWVEPEVRAFREVVPAEGPAAPAFPPYPLGMSFFDQVGPTELDFDGEAGVDWALLAVTPTEVLPLDPVGRVEVEGAWTLAVVNLGPPGFEAGDPMETASYSLSLLPISDPAPADPTASGCGCRSGGAPAGLAPWLGLPLLAAARRRARSRAAALLPAPPRCRLPPCPPPTPSIR